MRVAKRARNVRVAQGALICETRQRRLLSLGASDVRPFNSRKGCDHKEPTAAPTSKAIIDEALMVAGRERDLAFGFVQNLNQVCGAVRSVFLVLKRRKIPRRSGS